MNLAATMSLSAGAFSGPLAAVRGQLGGALGQIKSLGLLVTGLGGAFAGFKSAQSIVENFFAVFGKGHDLEKLSRTTGQSVKDLVALQRAFKGSGMDADGLGRQLLMLQKSLGGINENGEPTRAIFEQLGLSVERLQKMNAPAQIEAIGEKLRALPNAAQRTAAAMAIFGRSGAEMLNLLSDPKAIREAVATSRDLGDIYQRSAASFSSIVKAYEAIKGKAAGFFAGVAEGVAPLLQTLLTTLKKIDLVGLGRSVGQYLRAATEAFKNGSLGDLVALSLQVGFGRAINFFVASMKTALGTIGEIVTFTVNNFGAVSDVLVGAAATFGAALLKALEAPLSYVQAMFEKLFDGSLLDGANRAQRIAEARALEHGAGIESGIKYRGDSGKNLNPDEAAQYRRWQESVRAEMPGVQSDIAKDPLSDTLTQRAAKIRANGGVQYGFGGDTMNADAIATAAQDRMKEGAKSLESQWAGLMGKLQGTLGAFKIEDVTGVGASSAKLAELIDHLSKAGNGPGEKTGNGPGQDGFSLVSKAREAAGDRLAKIGLFVGGAGGPALDYARRTAVGIEKLHGLISGGGQIKTSPIAQGGYF